jgi:hypothetical protein
MKEIKICTQCKRELPANKDYYFMKLGKFNNRCKECCGRRFTNHLTHIPKEGCVFCKKCDRELPHTFQYFPEDKSCKTGLRYVCRECNPSYGRFLNDNEEPHREWSNEEKNLLISTYHDYTNKELQIKYFPTRSLRSLDSMADCLGIGWKSEETKRRTRAFVSEIVSAKLKGIDLGQEWRDKISATKKEYYKTHDSWWKGKKRSPEQCKQISERMKGKWAGDKNPRHINPLNGEKNGRWKGGILETYQELRSDTKDWFNQSMGFCNYKCVITNGEFDNIHHTTAFRDIVDKVFDITEIEVKPRVCDYEKCEFDILRSTLKDLHIVYGYGACINKDVHKLFHDNYGYTKFSPYDFLDFVYRIDVGEFDNWFNEKNLKIDINYEYMEYLESTLSLLAESA